MDPLRDEILGGRNRNGALSAACSSRHITLHAPMHLRRTTHAHCTLALMRACMHARECECLQAMRDAKRKHSAASDRAATIQTLLDECDANLSVPVANLTPVSLQGKSHGQTGARCRIFRRSDDSSELNEDVHSQLSSSRDSQTEQQYATAAPSTGPANAESVSRHEHCRGAVEQHDDVVHSACLNAIALMIRSSRCGMCTDGLASHISRGESLCKSCGLILCECCPRNRRSPTQQYVGLCVPVAAFCGVPHSINSTHTDSPANAIDGGPRARCCTYTLRFGNGCCNGRSRYGRCVVAHVQLKKDREMPNDTTGWTVSVPHDRMTGLLV